MMFGFVLAAVIGGPFPLLCTPYTEKGEVDCAVLVKEARFVADCGANGVIWPAADDLFAKFMYLRNLDNVLPSAQMRGWNLYVLRKRGVFPNTLSRVAKKTGGWALEDLKLTPGQIAEIDARLKFAGIE